MVVEIAGGQRIDGEEEPVPRQDRQQCQELNQRPAAEQQEDERVPEADLRENICESVVRPFGPRRREKNAECHKDERTPDGVPELPGPRLARCLSVREREGHRHADDEHEGGLDQIPERAAAPGDVVDLGLEDGPVGAFREIAGDLRECESRGSHRQHREAAVGVERAQPARGILDNGLRHHRLLHAERSVGAHLALLIGRFYAIARESDMRQRKTREGPLSCRVERRGRPVRKNCERGLGFPRLRFELVSEAR